MPETVPVSVHLFSFNRALTATRHRSMLLCSEITLPTEVGDSSDSWYSSRDGSRVQRAISDGRVLDALAVLQLPNESVSISSERQIHFLFASAHALLNQGNYQTADRCIQTALRILADGSPSQRGLQLPEWLVLATNALLRQDWQSCGLWLRQCDRSLKQSDAVASNSDLQKAAGDLFAIRACACVGQGSPDAAESMLLQAAEFHDRANAHLSMARDLILLARLLIEKEQYPAAELRLLEAEARLQAGDTLDLRGERLRRAIIQDRRVIASQFAAIAMARWN